MELYDAIWCIAGLYFFLEHSKNLTVDIFIDFLLIIASLLQPVKQRCIVTSQKDNQVEPSFREEVAAMEL